MGQSHQVPGQTSCLVFLAVPVGEHAAWDPGAGEGAVRRPSCPRCPGLCPCHRAHPGLLEDQRSGVFLGLWARLLLLQSCLRWRSCLAFTAW